MDCTKYLSGFPQHGSDNQSLETIRALHQTIVSLRTALVKSKSELQELKSKSFTNVETDIFRLAIEKLSIENHVLRQRILITKNLVKQEENVEVSKSPVIEKEHLNFMDQTPSKASIQTESDTEKEKFHSDNDESCDLASKGDNSHSDMKESKSRGISENLHQEINEEYRSKVQRENSQDEDTVQIKKNKASYETIDTEGYFEDDNESEELDDIELIFTTEDTKDLPTAQENLVSITDGESWNPIEGTPILLRYTEAQQFDEAPEDRLEGNESKMGINHAGNCFESVLGKTWENSIILETDISRCGVVDENISSTKSQLCQTSNFSSPSHHRPIIYGGKVLPGGMRVLIKSSPRYDARPSTIEVPVTQVEAGATRPILVDGHSSVRRESGAQTDITALPSRWRSEGYLTHKVSNNFTTLPSKFTISPSPLPSPTPHRDESKRHLDTHHVEDQRLHTERHGHLHLNEESREARRTLLSDINFTSMVPELSRSADHLCQDGGSVKGKHMDGGHCFLMDQRTRGKCDIRKDDSLLVCDLKRGYQLGCRRCKGSCSGMPSTWGCSVCRASITFRQTPSSWTSIPSTPNAQEIEWNTHVHRRNQWKKTPTKSPSWAFSVPSSPTNSHTLGSFSYPVSFPTCCTHRASCPLHYSETGNCTFIWGYDAARKAGRSKASVSHSVSSTSFSGTFGLNSRKSSEAYHRQKNRVTFKDSGKRQSCACPGNSLPDLRDDYQERLEEEEELWEGRGRAGNSISGGESTDSLIDEAEEFLRHSIDSILTGVDWARVGRRRQTRRHSDPDPVRELRPPQSAQPFLPKEPKDLRPECFTKVILSNGKVEVGRVRYSGILRGSDKEEYIVGVELPCHSGDSDGTYNGIRYFDCDRKKAVFVPFSKVILAWDT